MTTRATSLLTGHHLAAALDVALGQMVVSRRSRERWMSDGAFNPKPISKAADSYLTVIGGIYAPTQPVPKEREAEVRALVQRLAGPTINLPTLED